MHEYQMMSYEPDECLSKGICSVNPTLSSVQEVILLYIKELSFYLLRLKNLGATNETIKETVLYALFNLVTNADYNQEQFHELIVKLYDYIYQSKILYEKLCLEKNITIETSKSYFKYSKNFSLTDAIRKGEKYFIKKSHSFTPKQKDLYDIMIFLGKSMGLKIIELQRLGKPYDEAYYAILSLFNAITPGVFSEEETMEEIQKTITIYYSLVREVFYTQIELYGEIEQNKVSFSTSPGKAILFSGSDFKKLELVLKATEGTKIDVYTHGLEMLMAHAFPKLSSHPNLKGHFGTGMESSLVDFASFPGPVLMTRGTLQKIEYLYRGRLFTLDPIAAPGVIKLKDSDFDPLIKSALESKGFTRIEERPSIPVGYSKKDLFEKIDDIIKKIREKEINHLYIVGLLNAPNLIYKAYFEKFFNLLPDDAYVLSLCCPINTEKVFHLDSFYDYSLFYKIINKLNKELGIPNIKLNLFLTRCDKHTISNLIYLKHLGIKNVFMCKCPQTLVSPSIIKTMQEIFDIKEMTDPQKDLEETLKER